MTNNYEKIAQAFFESENFDISIYQNLFLSDENKSSDTQHLLHLFLSKTKNISPKFELNFLYNLAKDIPYEFVKAIRHNQSFLKENRINALVNVPLIEELKIHQRAWSKLYREELQLWNDIQNDISDIEGINPLEIFSDLIIWMENNRFDDDSKQNIFLLSSTYSFFIEIYLHKYPLIVNSLTGSLEKVFLERLTNQNSSSSNRINQLLTGISRWINFNNAFLQPYSYDDFFIPFNEHETVKFKQLNSELNRWKKDGIRYEINNLEYHLLASELLEELIESGKIEIPKGKNKKDEDINYHLAIKDTKMRLILRDTVVDNFLYGDTQSNAYLLIKPLLAYSVHGYARYEIGITEYKDTSKTWIESFFKLCKDSIVNGVEILPYLYMTNEEYIKLNCDATSQLPKETYEQIINHFSYSLPKKKKKYAFDRFYRKYDVLKKPFIGFGDILFSPMLLFANNDWFYSSIQAGIENVNLKYNIKERKSTSNKLEEKLSSFFESQGWKAKVITPKEASKIDGDIDVFVTDENITLLIQLKRTKLRLNLKDAYYEKINSDLKAFQQLNDAVKYLSIDNSIFPLAETSVKWLVSTSYENIGVITNGCNKVNYYDLINVLRTQSFNSLQDFIEYIERDKLFDKWADVYNNPEVPREIKLLIEESWFV